MPNIMTVFRHDSNSLGWGMLVSNIITDDGTKLKLLEDFQDCSLQLVKQQAVVPWQDHNEKLNDVFPLDMTQKTIDPSDSNKPEDLRMFYCRVCSKMIAKRIKNSLTMTSWKKIFSKPNISLGHIPMELPALMGQRCFRF